MVGIYGQEDDDGANTGETDDNISNIWAGKMEESTSFLFPDITYSFSHL